MCNGTIMDKLISFSLPLMLSGILQLMFNAVDIIVVGRFSGSQALAAVGSTTALINVFTNLFIGISLGANVLAARFYAAGKDREMSDTVHTAVTLALVSGIVMAFVGLIFSRWALELMGTPDDVIGQSALYMKIYFLGMPFFMLYNYGAAILRAVGDTKRPLIFLVISGVVNAVLNLILVIMFHMDVAGVAIATVVSQMISCILVIRCLCNSQTSYQLYFSKLRINKDYLKQIFQISVTVTLLSYPDLPHIHNHKHWLSALTAYAESLFADCKPFHEVLPPSFFASCDCSNLSAFWKVCVVLSLISSLLSCNTSDMQARCHYCHDIIRAWKNPTPEKFLSLFPVPGLHTQTEYLHSISHLMSD